MQGVRTYTETQQLNAEVLCWSYYVEYVELILEPQQK
jgi:hypothetical protein